MCARGGGPQAAHAPTAFSAPCWPHLSKAGAACCGHVILHDGHACLHDGHARMSDGRARMSDGHARMSDDHARMSGGHACMLGQSITGTHARTHDDQF